MRSSFLVGTTIVAAVLAGFHSASAGPSADPVRALAKRAGWHEPVFRIGLDSGPRVVVSATSRFRLVDPQTARDVWRDSFRGEVAVVAEGAPQGGAGRIFRVQVGSFADRANAKAEARRLRKKFGVETLVRHDPDRGTWRVRAGRARSRDRLGTLADRVRAAGYAGAWITEEPSRVASGVTLRVVDTRTYESLATGLTRIVAIAFGARGRLTVEGKPYRGVVEFRISPYGTVRAINWVELEQYLLGVVPAEMGPEVWPQLEALKAQAVAARTYAWRHRGQFEDEGFDLCATPRCQVYGGAAAEHPLSDRAISETRDEILTWRGEPINAYYTSTCGGHTEDGWEIFPGEDEPYLRGVPCRAEREVLESLAVPLEGRPPRLVPSPTGRDISRDWALLAAAGVLDPDRDPETPMDSGAIRAAASRLTALCGRPGPEDDPGADANAPADLGGALDLLARSLGWQDRARILLEDDDIPALLRDPDASRMDPQRKRLVAYLLLDGGLKPYPDGRLRLNGPAASSRLAPVMVRMGEAYAAFGLADGVVAGGGRERIRLVVGKEEETIPVASAPFLFSLEGGRRIPVARLVLRPGDRVRYRMGPDGGVDFLELQPPVKGTSDDRAAKVYSWEVRRSRRDLERRISRRVSVGRLKDLQVMRRGRSGRIVELRVVGSRGTAVVKGFDVRKLLDLRESLTVIEPQRDANGELQAVVFAGKGWGHGVGLCQVGAYGMALRGSGYREILLHYYTGVKIGRIEPGAGE